MQTAHISSPVLWNHPLVYACPLYAYCIRKISTIYRTCLIEPVAPLIRPLFFPYFSKLDSSEEQKAKKIFSDFWCSSVKVRPELENLQKAKELFTKKDLSFEITFRDELLSIFCTVIESIGLTEQERAFTVVHALGIDCTENNDLLHTAPLLQEFAREHPDKKSRFILISQYSAKHPNASPYKHVTLEEAGALFSKVLKRLSEIYTTIDLLIGHSLGGIVTSASLPYIDTPPRHLILDRSASSVQELSRAFWYGPFCIALPFFRGWNIDFGKNISEFISRQSGKCQVVVLSALHDHRFKGGQNLCQNPYILSAVKAQKIELLVLEAPARLIGKWQQHSLPLDAWQFIHIEKEKSSQTLLTEEKNLASSLLKRGLSTYDLN